MRRLLAPTYCADSSCRPLEATPFAGTLRRPLTVSHSASLAPMHHADPPVLHCPMGAPTLRADLVRIASLRRPPRS